MKSEKEDYIIGYIYEGYFYKEFTALHPSVWSKDEPPIKVYNPAYIEGLCMAVKTLQDRQKNCVEQVFKTLCPDLVSGEPLFKESHANAVEILSKIKESAL